LIVVLDFNPLFSAFLSALLSAFLSAFLSALLSAFLSAFLSVEFQARNEKQEFLPLGILKSKQAAAYQNWETNPWQETMEFAQQNCRLKSLVMPVVESMIL
jgi:hypothetical protein